MHPSGDSFIRRALREPTVHFALLAILLFAVAAVVKSVNRPIVEIDRRFVELRVRQLERGLGTSLTDDERRNAEAAYVDERILAAEARARGLDDDERIRAILHQKMLHVLAGDVPQPTDRELQAYFQQHRDRYAGRPAVTVEEVVAPERTRPAARRTALEHGASAPQAVLRKTVLSKVTEGELAWSFGEETAARVAGASPGIWVGPHASIDGEHWFRVLERHESTAAPALDAIRDQVRYDWMAEAEVALLQDRVDGLRRRYAVRFGSNGVAP
jgi:hypothetical protein